MPLNFKSQTESIAAGFRAVLNDASRAEASRGKIQLLPLAQIDDFKNHPFLVRDDEEMEQLMESIRANGIITPITVRRKDDGRYEMISGHRRRHACNRLQLETIPALVLDIDDDEATIRMVDANLQREHILPSEKAKAYKMKMDAMRRQGKRTDLTSTPMARKSETADVIGQQIGESGDQVRRYIRLNELIPELQELVDQDKLGFRAAVELSYLTHTEQSAVLAFIRETDSMPSLQQAKDWRRRAEEDPAFDPRVAAPSLSQRTDETTLAQKEEQTTRELQQSMEQLLTPRAGEKPVEFVLHNGSEGSTETPADDNFHVFYNAAQDSLDKLEHREAAEKTAKRICRDLQRLQKWYAGNTPKETADEFQAAAQAIRDALDRQLFPTA